MRPEFQMAVLKRVGLLFVTTYLGDWFVATVNMFSSTDCFPYTDTFLRIIIMFDNVRQQIFGALLGNAEHTH